MKKRILAIVLSAAMVLSVLPFSAFASTETETSPYASGLNDTAYYLMKIPEAEQLGKSNVSNNYTVGNQYVGPIREEDGELFVVYNEETSYHSSRDEDAFTYNGWTPGINAPLFTYEEAVNGLPASIPLPTTGEGEEQVEDASTLWIAIRIKINDNGAAFEKTTSALRLYFANGGSNAMVNGNDKPAKWLDLNDGSMTWFYTNSGDNKGSSSDLQFTGDMNGYLMIPFTSTAMTAADLRSSFSGFAFRFVTGTKSTAATGCKESSWEDKEFLVGDAFLLSDPVAFQTARTQGIVKYAPNGGEDTAYHAVRIGGYRTRYSGLGIDSSKYDTAFFDKDYADPDLAGGKTSGAVVHITTLPNGDRAVEMKVNKETVAVKDPETGEAVTDPETGEPVTEEVGMSYNAGSQYMELPAYDTYEDNKDGTGTSADRTLTNLEQTGIPDEIDFSKVKYLAVRVAAVGGEGKTYLFNAGIGYQNTTYTAYSSTYYPITRIKYEGDEDYTWQTYTYVDVNTGEVYDLTSASNGHKIKAGFDGYVLFPLNSTTFNGIDLTELEKSFGFYPLSGRASIKVRMCEQESINGKWSDGESALYYGGALWVEDKDTFTAYHSDCDNLGHNYKETGRTGADCENPGSITYVCERCDEPYTEPIPALGHEYGELVPAVGETHTATELAPAVAAYYQCSECEKYFTEEKVETTLAALTSVTPSHSYGDYVNTDDNQHWKECSCGSKIEVAAHEYTIPNKDDTHHWNECACGKVGEKVEHDYATPNKDETNHWNECACGAQSEITPHDFIEAVDEQYLVSAATCAAKAVYKKSCSVCGIAHATETFETGEVDADGHTAPVGGKAKEYCANNCGTVIYDLEAELNKGGEYVLPYDVVIDECISIQSDVVFDLNGKTITDNVGCGLRVYANVTIKNGTVNSVGTALYVDAEGTLTVESGEYNINDNSSEYIDAAIYSYGNAIINGGTFNTVAGKAYSVRVCGSYGEAEIVINGGIFNGPTVACDGGKLTINGGNFSSEAKWSETEADILFAYEGGVVVVKGGTFVGQNPANASTGSGTVSYVADGYDVTADANTYVVAAHVHSYGDYINTDDAQHWKECVCGDKTEVAAHDYTTPNKDDTHHWNECVCGRLGEKVEHDYATPNKDDTYHWTECACGAIDGKAEHSFATAKTDDTHHWNECACGVIDNKVEHTYTTPNKDDTHHWNECVCGKAGEKVEHDYATPNKDDTYHWTECSCGAIDGKAEHSFATPNRDAENHWTECACGAKKDVAPHDFATPKTDDTYHWTECACGAVDGKAEHNYATSKYDDEQHWNECACGKATVKEAHKYDAAWDKDCNVCSDEREITYTGWAYVSSKWYRYENGEMVVSAWRKDSKGWVYLGTDGAMVTNKWVKDSKGWCYVGADGYAVTNCWKKDSHGWIYLDSNGSMTKSKWVKDAGKWYYCDANGYMVANKWMKDSKGWVYLGSNGAMVTNKWVKDSKGWCYVGADGYAVTNCWKKDSHGWIYLDSNGSMTKSKWVQTSGKWYYCDANGYMVANTTLTIGGKSYTFNASGVWVK